MTKPNPPIAIVGYAVRLPGSGASLDTFWQAIVSGRDCAREVPEGRWLLPPQSVLNPVVPTPDKVPTARGYFLDPFQVEADGLSISSSLLEQLDPLFHLVLDVGHRAWKSARTTPLDRSRVGVVLGNICLPTELASRLAQECLGHHEATTATHPLNRSVVGLPAGLLAKALGLGAGTFTLDAACASSLYALKLACDELQAGRADAMLAGGMNRADSLYTQMGFAQLRALSPNGRCAPFDASANGLVVGEGAGVFVLKRLEDAERDGDAIRAVIRGWGLSNDVNGNLLAPAKEGQLRAMRSAYQMAGWQPHDVQLIECHATGTPVGDAVEYESLAELLGSSSAVIGSVKSTVGHLLTGAGAAALAKVLLSLQHETLPPQANFTARPAHLRNASSTLRVLSKPEPWKPASAQEPRRAAVSGFGFGGVNAHMLVEEYTGPQWKQTSPKVSPALQPVPVAIIGVAERVGSGELRDGVQPDDPANRHIEALRVPLDRFRIPPAELAEMLPQQLLMLQVAADALADAGSRAASADLALNTATFIGLGLDFNTTNYHLRWSELPETTWPALTADRTMGALGSITASRIARTFGFGGPSFTCCSEEASAGTALQLGLRALQLGEVDRAVVGGVDLRTDPRMSDNALSADGAACLILKRLDDATRDGDAIYAVLHASGQVGNDASVDSALQRACADAQWESTSIDHFEMLDQSQSGFTGFASLAVAAVRTCRALKDQMLPPSAISSHPQVWLTDQDRPRRAAVCGRSVDGNSLALLFEEGPFRQPPVASRDLPEAIFAVDGGTVGDLHSALARLDVWVQAQPACSVHDLGQAWNSIAPLFPSRKLALAIVARDSAQLLVLIPQANARLDGQAETAIPSRRNMRDRIFFSAKPLAGSGKLAFVFPGSGNHYAGMGRQLAWHFPHIIRKQETENTRLRSQYAPSKFWSDAIPTDTTAKEFLFGQVSFGTLVSDILLSVGVKPDAMVGLSLGESAGLFGLRIWQDRDEMLQRIHTSTLFGSDLGPPYNAARQHWGLAEQDELDWITCVMTVPPEAVRRSLTAGMRAYLLIVNTPNECVIGGNKDDVEELVRSLGKPFLPLDGVTLAHCEAAAPVESAYRDLHTLPTTVQPTLKVFSGAWAAPYIMSRANAAESITAALTQPLDFPAVVEAAYQDGVRGFIEIGPGGSCTRMIGSILQGRTHFVRSVSAQPDEECGQLLRVLAALIAERSRVNLGPLFGEPTRKRQSPASATSESPTMIVPVGVRNRMSKPPRTDATEPVEIPSSILPPTTPQPTIPNRPQLEAFVAATIRTRTATADAHQAFVRLQNRFLQTTADALHLHYTVLDRMANVAVGDIAPQPLVLRDVVPRSLTYAECCEFAVGKIGNVLGATFAEVDRFPTRVRLPDGPLMLVDRILRIEGEPKSMKSGRVLTEHTVHDLRWYLDNGRCPTSVTVEAGQADLFLAGFLGIDFHTQGLAVYRLLDAVVSYHRDLPRVGERIEYDIRIDEFFRQADSWLFRFCFEGSIEGEPLLSMRHGVAGFFTSASLAAGQGIVHTKLDLQPMPGRKPEHWRSPVPFTDPTTLNARQVTALHDGDLATAFGPAFADAKLQHPMRLPAGMLKLVDRVPVLDPRGGRFGLGFVRAEYDIKPREWFIECHFVDDKVMPGTLMYECCLHTLRILLMRFGWVGEEGEVTCEPVPGIESRLKCRGQVLETTRVVTYEVSIKELGDEPNASCIADALMFADGKPIVEILNLSVRMTGLTPRRLTEIWPDRVSKTGSVVTHQFVYGPERIHAYSNGKPSEAFGEPYRVFDTERVLARLPGPPYQFLDGITAVQGEPFVLQDGASCTASYAVPPNAWYFEANRCSRMPFSILLEIALQPCGWLAAYCGSALTSDQDLSFRNLGGHALQHAPVGPDIGTLTTTVTMTKVSKSAGMVIQNFDLTVMAGARTLYEGTTYFGFFAKDALRNQVGMPSAQLPVFSDDQLAFAEKGHLPKDAPFPSPMLRMVDTIDAYLPQGGKHGLGLIRGRIAVDPDFWFFKAHFYQDPVWPGSLGLESFLQLLKYVAWRRWKSEPRGGWQTVGLGRSHSWTYRGQVLPSDREVQVTLEVTEVDEIRRTLKANGFLTVDGRIIYQMTDFTLE